MVKGLWIEWSTACIKRGDEKRRRTVDVLKRCVAGMARQAVGLGKEVCT